MLTYISIAEVIIRFDYILIAGVYKFRHTCSFCNRCPPGDMEDVDGEAVDYGEEDADGSPSGSKARTEMNFQGKVGEHLVKVSIWDKAKSAVLCIR